MTNVSQKFVPAKLAAAVVTAWNGEVVAIAKARKTQDQAVQKVLDAITLACDKPKALFMKGNAKTNEAREEVKAMFDALVEKKFISQSTATSYGCAFWIAFEQGIPFQRDLNNKKEGAGTKPEAQTSGKVISTTRTELDKTLSKALAQARALGLTEFAATILDHCLESLEGFKETVLAK